MALLQPLSTVRLPGMVSLGNVQLPNLQYGRGAEMAPQIDSGSSAFAAGFNMTKDLGKPIGEALAEEFDPAKKKKKALEMALMDAKLSEAELDKKLLLAEVGRSDNGGASFATDENGNPVLTASTSKGVLSGLIRDPRSHKWVQDPEVKRNQEMEDFKKKEQVKMEFKDANAMKQNEALAYKDWLKEYQNASPGSKDALGTLGDLNAKNITGWEHRVPVVKQFIENVTGVGKDEAAFESLTGPLLKENKLPGSQSNFDVQLLIKQAPSLDKSPEANKQIIEGRKALLDRHIQYGNFINTQTKTGAGFGNAQKAWSEYVDANPLMTLDKNGNIVRNPNSVSIDQWINRDREAGAPTASPGATPTTSASSVSPERLQQIKEFIQANPNDPRAAEFKRLLGL